jgi:hypothetical protein
MCPFIEISICVIHISWVNKAVRQLTFFHHIEIYHDIEMFYSSCDLSQLFFYVQFICTLKQVMCATLPLLLWHRINCYVAQSACKWALNIGVSVLWHCIIQHIVTVVLEDPAASIFKHKCRSSTVLESLVRTYHCTWCRSWRYSTPLCHVC